MKQTSFLIFYTLIAISLFGQSNTPQQNNTIIRLTILNDHNEILVRETQYGWMTLATYFNSRQNINEILDSLAHSYGIECTNATLAGVFTYKYKFKPTSDIRLLYVASFKSGRLQSPVETERLYWLPVNEAINKLRTTVSSLGDMTKQILDYPDILWGGSFILDRKDGKLISEVEEDFYQIRGN